jgi:hypothetical protein
MKGYALIAFAAFFGCCFAQFWFVQRIRKALIERHPDTFLAIEKSAIFPGMALRRFLRKGRYRSLNDLELNRRVRDLKVLYLIGFLCWLAYGVSLFTDPVFRH